MVYYSYKHIGWMSNFTSVINSLHLRRKQKRGLIWQAAVLGGFIGWEWTSLSLKLQECLKVAMGSTELVLFRGGSLHMMHSQICCMIQKYFPLSRDTCSVSLSLLNLRKSAACINMLGA